jgi:hypothetical protein
MTYLTNAMFHEAIATQEREFDSHQIIDYFYRNHQVAYVRELMEHISVGSYPFTETNRQIGMALARFTNLIARVGDHRSRTLGGEETSCAVWRRL